MLSTTTATPKKQPPGKLQERHIAQQKIICFVHGYLSQNQYAPTNREICENLNLSMGSLQHHLEQLEEDGWIRRLSHVDRGIQLWFQIF